MYCMYLIFKIVLACIRKFHDSAKYINIFSLLESRSKISHTLKVYKDINVSIT